MNSDDPGVVAVGSIGDAGPDARPTVPVTMGRAYFLNVPPGPLTMTAALAADGKPVSQVSVNVAASTTTVLNLLPSP